MNVCDTLSLIFAVNPMENPVGSWNVTALKTERSHGQAWKSVTGEQRVTEGHACTQQPSSREEPSRDSDREHPGEGDITGAQEGSASRRQPRSTPNSRGRSNQMRTETYALWPLGGGQPLCKGRVQGEVGLPASAWNQSLNVRRSQPTELSQKPLATKERVTSLSLSRVCSNENIFQPGLNCQFRTDSQGTLSK